MDFFAQQDAARLRSRRLTVLAVVSAVPIVLVTALVLLGSGYAVHFVVSTRAERAPLEFVSFCLEYPQAPLAAFLTALLIVLVSGACAYSRVGSGVALMSHLGARRASRCRDDELRLFNVVEEMTVASGVEAPSVWVMDADNGVNAFAAGFDACDSAVCVSLGAIRNLTRDELQAVIAHEFAHILNGDMRLNLHLTALVEALGGIAGLGKAMLSPFRLGDSDSDSHGGGFRWRGGGRSGKGGGLLAALILVYLITGCLLWGIGLIGVFFSRILQRAVSREREYLADAAAVEFTRNPEALANALRFSHFLTGAGWFVRAESAANVCHMLFVGTKWGVDTHPPLADRIARLSQGGVGACDDAFRARVSQARAERARVCEIRTQAYSEHRKSLDAVRRLNEATKLPAAFNARMRDPAEAGAAICALLNGERLPEWPREMTGRVRRLAVNKAVMSLKTFGTEVEIRAWADKVETLAKDAAAQGPFGFMVWCAVRRKLRDAQPVRYRAPSYLTQPVAGVISTVAAFGANPDEAYEQQRGRLAVFFPGYPDRPEPYADIHAFASALDGLRALTPIIKRELLESLKEVVGQDGVVTDDEAASINAVADAIGAYGWDVL